MKHYVIILWLIIIASQLPAQDFGTIICPQPDDSVAVGEILIVFSLDNELKLKTSSLKIKIDLKSYDYLVKIKNNKLKVLLTEPLDPGYKIITVEIRDSVNNILTKKWGFNLVSKSEMPVVAYPENNYVNRKKLKVRLNVEAFSRIADITGEGAHLRQEPPVTNELRFRGNIKNNNIEIPLKLFITNHENGFVQPRDRFLIGIKAKNIGILVGDVNPYLGNLILNRSRVRGAEAYLSFNWIRFRIVAGAIKRGIEGELLYYNSFENPNYAPVNLQVIPNADDSTTLLQGYYSDSGTYKRNLIAARLSFGSQKSKFWLHFIAAKSTDDTNSISYGGQAAENLVFGSELDFTSKNKKFGIEMGISAAFTTRDIRNGVTPHDTIKSISGVDLWFDPEKVSDLLVINTTTNFITKHTPFLSYYTKPWVKFANQNITMELKRIGSDYHSFGNPYLINDRLYASFSDRMYFLKRRLFISLNYRYFADNLSKVLSVTNSNNIVDASFNLFFKSKLPRLTGGYRIFLRDAVANDSIGKDNSYNISNYRMGLFQSFVLLNANSSVMLGFNLNTRNNLLQSTTINNYTLNIDFTQNYSFGLFVTLRYNYLLLTNDEDDLSKNNTYNLRLGYTTRNDKLMFWVSARQIHFIETPYYPESLRSSFSGGVRYMLIKNLEFELKAGQSVYNELTGSKNDYNEFWGMLKISYQFLH